MHITSYTEARKYLESFIHPGQKIIKRVDGEQSLIRVKALLAILDNPHEKFRTVQVSGTAGKGSTSYFLSSILTQSGYKTGLTISPHLESLTERIQINNCPITENEYIKLLNNIISAIDTLDQVKYRRLTYTEILMVMAFTYFAQERVNIAVVEVGLEGKYDSSNVLSPLISIITNIHLDHTEFLGESIEAIAKEAVSIITSKDQITIVGQMQKSVLDIVSDKVQETGGTLRVMGKQFQTILQKENDTLHVFDYSGELIITNIHVAMKGRYQIDNASLAIDAALQLRHFGFEVSDDTVHDALSAALFPGRFETLTYQNQKIILDGAHNPVKMTSFVQALEEYYPEYKKIVILGFKKGKMIHDILSEVLPIADTLILTEFRSTLEYTKNAAMDVSDIEQIIEDTHFDASNLSLSQDTQDAIQQALAISDPKSLIVITGSLYLVGEARKLIRQS